MQSFYELFIARQDELLGLFWDHLNMTVLAVLVASAIGIPLGILIAKSRRLAVPVMALANILQSVPCIALLAFAIPFVGIGAPAAVVMVVVYALLPILKNTYTGILSVDPKLYEVARGMGMSKLRYLKTVEWPLSAPAIMSGVRIATVSAVGTMTIAAFAGAGGLGWYINLGLNAQNQTLVLLGAIPASLMAVGLDALLGVLERRVSAVKMHHPSTDRRSKVRDALLVLALSGLVVSPIAHCMQSYIQKEGRHTVVVGAANFTEAIVLGHVFSELIQKETGLKVDERFNLNGEGLCYTALDAGKIDAFIGYTGAIWMNYLHKPLVSKVPETVLSEVRQSLETEKHLVTSGPIGFSNTYQLTVSPSVAQRERLETVEDLMANADHLTIGATVDFMQRDDGVPALIKAYGGHDFKSKVGLDGSLRYSALAAEEVDVIDAFSTDGLLEKIDCVALRDDDHFFPPYDAIAMMRQGVVSQYPALKNVVDQLEGLIDQKDMRRMNYLVDVEGKDARQVAVDFLTEKGLL